MTTLVIKDLSLTTDLDRTVMSSIRGGFFGVFGLAYYSYQNQTKAAEQKELDALLPHD